MKLPEELYDAAWKAQHAVADVVNASPGTFAAALASAVTAAMLEAMAWQAEADARKCDRVHETFQPGRNPMSGPAARLAARDCAAAIRTQDGEG